VALIAPPVALSRGLTPIPGPRRCRRAVGAEGALHGRIQNKEGKMVIDPENEEQWLRYMDDPDVRDEPGWMRKMYAYRRYLSMRLRSMTPEEEKQHMDTRRS
jgi:hypothetical protein